MRHPLVLVLGEAALVLLLGFYWSRFEVRVEGSYFFEYEYDCEYEKIFGRP